MWLPSAPSTDEPATGIVASTFAFDLDDVGAEVGQQLSGPGSCEDAGKLKDAEARQWLRHVWKLPGKSRNEQQCRGL